MPVKGHRTIAELKEIIAVHEATIAELRAEILRGYKKPTEPAPAPVYNITIHNHFREINDA